MWKYKRPNKGFFTEKELKQLKALFDPIIPFDQEQKIPGAAMAHAHLFLHYLLAMDETTHNQIPEWRKLYREGLPVIADCFFRRHNIRLEEGTIDDRTQLLKDLEEGLLDTPDTLDGKAFFYMLKRHCIQGSFSDPRWGGNKDRIMWKWIGYLTKPTEVIHDA